MIIKICGIRSLEAARAAAACGADFIGFVFAPSRRAIAPTAAAEICRAVDQVRKVGVFVDAKAEEVNRIAALCGLDFVQLHGKESPAYCEGIDRPVIKAFRFGEDFSPGIAGAYPAELLLIDSWQPGQAGGTGKTFSWQQARAELAGLRKPFLVAGGLDETNVGEAIRVFKPYGIDVSGGVEEDGVKSALKIKSFIETARKAERRMEHDRYIK